MDTHGALLSTVPWLCPDLCFRLRVPLQQGHRDWQAQASGVPLGERRSARRLGACRPRLHPDCGRKHLLCVCGVRDRAARRGLHDPRGAKLRVEPEQPLVRPRAKGLLERKATARGADLGNLRRAPIVVCRRRGESRPSLLVGPPILPEPVPLEKSAEQNSPSLLWALGVKEHPARFSGRRAFAAQGTSSLPQWLRPGRGTVGEPYNDLT